MNALRGDALAGRHAVVTGGARGIGLAIARRCLSAGASVALWDRDAALLAEALQALAPLGTAATALVDVRDEAQIERAAAQSQERFGGIDILVNNASAIWLRGALDTPMKRFDLMAQVNSRGSFLCAQACLPHLLKAQNPHILTLAPPPSLDPKWWAPHTGYTLAKMGMSFVTLGLAAEFADQGVAINALWPRTLIATDALNMIPGVDSGNGRKPEIMADAAHAVLTQPARAATGRFYIDDEVLRAAGVGDFSAYAVDPTKPLLPDLFLD